MASDVLGGRVNNNACTMVERPSNNGRSCIVHNQWNAQFLADCGDFSDGEHMKLWIGQGFSIVSAGAGVRGTTEVFWVDGVDKASLDAKLLESVGKQVPGAAVQVSGGHEVVARLRNVEDRVSAGCLS